MNAFSTTRVSVNNNGTQGNNNSFNPAISASGRFVVFESIASNLVKDDANRSSDIFIRDLNKDTTTQVSVAFDGTQGNNNSFNPAISADGRFVAFESNASNLVASDTNNTTDIFVRDRQTGTITRVSVANNGTQGNSSSSNPAISADGRFVAFYSGANNLVTRDTNNRGDIFVRDRQTGTTTLVSVADNGTQGNLPSLNPAISADGRFVAFESTATNLVAFDTNNLTDIFVRDLQTGTTTRVSVADDGTQGNNNSLNPAISGDGRFVAFDSRAFNLIRSDTNNSSDIFVRDLLMGTITRVSVALDGTQGNNSSFNPAISANGRFVAFESSASNLVADDTNNNNGISRDSDIFVRDLLTGTITLVSVADDGTEGNNTSVNPAISTDVSFVAFESRAFNLVAKDTNNSPDIFIRETNNPLNIGGTDLDLMTIVLGANINGFNHNEFLSLTSSDTLTTLINVDPTPLNPSNFA